MLPEGVYYESNGHGTILFNEEKLSDLESFIVTIEKENEEKPNPEVVKFVNSAKQLALTLRISNQVCGLNILIFKYNFRQWVIQWLFFYVWKQFWL